ncbi:hypothetical protein EV363DRAFT_1403791 [Boletus edulis]|nr:hypothetical protein EV363DRAFT_1403791 [Boletus edulis]
MSSKHAGPQDNPNNQYTAKKIMDMYSGTFAQDSSKDLRLATIRAALRHGAHTDGSHNDTKTHGGLHPAYISFNPPERSLEQRTFSRTELIEASLADVFDAITMQDRLDGGISLLIRCPGTGEEPAGLTADKVTVDVYITPRELVGNERVSGDTAMLVQAFCQEFAVPHLRRFIERCAVESVKPPRQRQPISFKGPNHLPRPITRSSSRIQCIPVNAEPDASDPAQLLSPSAAIREAITPIQLRIVRKRRLADAFLDSSADKILSGPIPLVIPPGSPALGPPLISLGPNTDAVLDRFRLGDQLLPRLHTLVRTVRDTRWKAVLSTAPWNLTHESATCLANALAADLKDTPGTSRFPIIGTVLQLIANVTLVFALYVLVKLFFYY